MACLGRDTHRDQRTMYQGCGSAFISSGSSILGWIPIRIRIRIRIQSGSRALMNKNWRKKFQLNNFFFWSRTSIYLSLGLHKERPSYRRSRQITKEAIQNFKTWTFNKISTFVGHFCHPLTRLNPDPIRIRIRIRNPAMYTSVHINRFTYTSTNSALSSN